jgi:hypothetical protein
LKQTILNIPSGSSAAYSGPILDAYACCASNIGGATPAEKPEAAKQYSEVEFIQSTANTSVLVMNSRYSEYGAYSGGNFTNTIAYQSWGQLDYWSTTGTPLSMPAPSFTTGDVIGIAADHLNQKISIVVLKNPIWWDFQMGVKNGKIEHLNQYNDFLSLRRICEF